MLRKKWQIARGLRGVFLSDTGTPGSRLGPDVSACFMDFRHPFKALTRLFVIINPENILPNTRVQTGSLRPELINFAAERAGLAGNSECGDISIQFMAGLERACFARIGAQMRNSDSGHAISNFIFLSTELHPEGYVPTSAFVDMRPGELS